MDLEIARTKGVTPRAHRASLMFASDPEKASGEEVKVALNPRRYPEDIPDLKLYFCHRLPVSLRKMWRKISVVA